MIKRLQGLLPFALLGVVALACNLSAAPPTNTPPPTLPPFIIVTPTPILQPTRFPGLPTVAAFPTTCSIRTDWFVYVVQPGDTLGTIATRVGTTADVLATANCLANANLISVNQQLRVPRQPALPTATQFIFPTATQFLFPTAASSTAPTAASVIIQPATQRGDGAFVVLPGTLGLAALGVSNATRVDFYVAQTGGSPILVGTDSALADGAAIQWSVPNSNFDVMMVAVASNASGQRAQTPVIRVVAQSQNATFGIGALAISPAFDDPARPGFKVVQPGQKTLSVPVQAAIRVDFYFRSDQFGGPVKIGEVLNPSTSAQISWTVGGPTVNGNTGLLWAVATAANGQTASTASNPVAFVQ
jgi:LysM repeat protein